MGQRFYDAKTGAIFRTIAFTLAVALATGDELAFAAIPVNTTASKGLPLRPGPDLDVILAQSVDHPGNGGQTGGGGRKGEPSGGIARSLSSGTTAAILRDLYSIRNECRSYDNVYRIDCLRQGIAMTVARMPDTGDYAPARSALQRASIRLAQIVEKYRDTNAPKLETKKGANRRFTRKRTYTAIRTDALPKALKEADAVITEASTMLLRSSENSERRYAHYQQIAVAVDSEKVLLRSL